MQNARDTVEELGGEIRALRRDFADLMERLKDAGEDHASAAARAAGDMAAAARDRLDHAATVTRKRAKVAIGEAEKAIADRPGTAVAVALGLGVVAGAIALSLLRRD